MVFAADPLNAILALPGVIRISFGIVPMLKSNFYIYQKIFI